MLSLRKISPVRSPLVNFCYNTVTVFLYSVDFFQFTQATTEAPAPSKFDSERLPGCHLLFRMTRPRGEGHHHHHPSADDVKRGRGYSELDVSSVGISRSPRRSIPRHQEATFKINRSVTQCIMAVLLYIAVDGDG